MKNNPDTERYEALRAHLEKLDLSEEEKSSSFKHIEAWYAQDKAFGTLYAELARISPKIETLLEEMGLV